MREMVVKKNLILALLIAVMFVTVLSVRDVSAEVTTMPDGNLFDPEYYLAAYPEVYDTYGDLPLDLYRHYIEHGKAEGKQPYHVQPKQSIGWNIDDFGSIGVVGDSFASGAISVNGVLTDVYSVSWPQIMGKKHSMHVDNYTKGGLTTESWLLVPEGSARMNASAPNDLYILILGLNDCAIVEPTRTGGYLGEPGDITRNASYLNYPDTFYGNYGKIIEQIRAHAPAAQIVMVTINYPTVTAQKYNEAIMNIARYYGIPFVCQNEDAFFASDTYTNMEMGHPTKAGYEGMADAIPRLIFNSLRF